MSPDTICYHHFIVGNLDQKGYLAIEPILLADRFNVDEEYVIQLKNKIYFL